VDSGKKNLSMLRHVKHDKKIWEEIKMAIMQEIETKLQKGISVSSNEEVYFALLDLVKEKAEGKVSNKGKKKLYYISAEFLIGKLLSNNLINLGIYDEVKETLAKNGKSLAEIEEVELEPSLGNGGLGRLAACFIDSIATLGLNGDGVGLNYHYGLFKQVFENNLQKETPNPWITEKSWLTKTDITYPVSFGGFTVQSRLYDIDVVGYNNRTTKLHLFDIESVDESIVGDTIDFDKEDIKKNLTLFLYPDDSDDKGRLLRVYQQYFMVSNAARLILAEAEAKGSNLHDLADYAAVQINDTHPSMVIPELIRLLQERGILMDEAIEIVTKVCAYTNHTILAEALEKWPIYFLEKAVPQLMPIIRELDNKVRAKVSDESTYIIKDGLVHMAHMDIHYGYSVNGVAYLHTEILKNTELNNFYKLYPEKFNNKTNGITFRRWLMSCNPELSAYITELIGDGWKKDANELEKLSNFLNDDAVLTKLVDIKNEKKTELASYLKTTQGLDVPDNSIFDIQVKRLHEYKRQQLNVLYIIRKYFEIKAGKKPTTPITCFFGAKAAPAYIIAKDIIHAILCLQQIINNDPEVSPYLKVFMVENYNVTLAEKLFPAANISEQISLASKEASGTGNMKFMLNGAVTLGTSDGANVEIAELVGDENIYVFGEDSQTVIDRYERGDYCSKDYYDKDENIKKAVDFLVSDEMLKVGSKENLERLYNELLNKDWFMTFPDFEDYCKTKEKAYADYEDKKAWAKKMLVNISKAGFFSSDRTIEQYNKEIWHLEE
jgi:starch phosphorylase